MAFIGPKQSDWSERAYSASVGGFNLLRDFEPEMHRVYPETRKYKFGFYSESGVPERSTYGWVHLKGSMWDVEDFNGVVGLRFGVTVDASDNVKHGENFIMIMPRQYRDEILLPAEKQKIVALEELSEKAGAFVHPSDPEKNKMQDAAMKIASTERYKVQFDGEPDHGEAPKNKGGRPKGSKNKPKAD